MKNQTQLINATASQNKWLHSPWQRGSLVLALTISSFVLSPVTQAVNPPPDGGYPAGNTAEGEDALFSLPANAIENTAVGFRALYFNTANYNTAVGAAALDTNTDGYENTATGWLALESNTSGFNNTA